MNITKETVFFFDMDGTLVNTNLANFLSYQAALSHVTASDASIMKYNPMVRLTRNQIKQLFPLLTDIEYQSIITEKEKYYNRYISTTTLIRENIDILLKYSATNNLALVSKENKNRVEETLSFHKLLNKFTYIFCGDTSTPSKEYNKYTRAITLLGISPQKIIAFEDEEDEISDAKEAGIKFINPKNLSL